MALDAVQNGRLTTGWCATLTTTLSGIGLSFVEMLIAWGLSWATILWGFMRTIKLSIKSDWHSSYVYALSLHAEVFPQSPEVLQKQVRRHEPAAEDKHRTFPIDNAHGDQHPLQPFRKPMPCLRTTRGRDRSHKELPNRQIYRRTEP